MYQLRYLTFLYLQRWHGIATRYAKSTVLFLAVVQIYCIAIGVQFWHKREYEKISVNKILL